MAQSSDEASSLPEKHHFAQKGTGCSKCQAQSFRLFAHGRGEARVSSAGRSRRSNPVSAQRLKLGDNGGGTGGEGEDVLVTVGAAVLPVHQAGLWRGAHFKEQRPRGQRGDAPDGIRPRGRPKQKQSRCAKRRPSDQRSISPKPSHTGRPGYLWISRFPCSAWNTARASASCSISPG